MSRLHKILHRLLMVSALFVCSAGFGINTVSPGLGVALAGELTPVHPGYPEVFDVSGSVEYMEGDTLVVNDASFFLLPSATYHSPNGIVGRSAISKGSKVGLLLTEDRGVESVWILETRKAYRDKSKKKDTTLPGTGAPYKKEKGVWKN